MIDPTYQGSVPVSEFVEAMVNVRLHFKNAPSEIVEALTLQVCQEFCTTTKVVTRQYRIPVYACSRELVIPIPDYERIVHVMSANIGEMRLRPVHDEYANVGHGTCYVEDNLIILGEDAVDDGMLMLKVSIAPTPLADKLSVVLLDKHIHVIEYGVLALLYKAPSITPTGSTKSDFSYFQQVANQYMNQYNKGVTVAMQRNMLGTSRGRSIINLGRVM